MRLAAILYAAFFAGILAHGESRASQEDAIREAVFQYMLPKQAPAANDFQVYFLEIDEEKTNDPSDKIMKDLAGVPARLAKLSESRLVRNGDGGVIDKKTKEKGEIISVGKITWISDVEVSVTSSAYQASLGMEDYDCTLQKVGKRWKVVKQVMTGISWNLLAISRVTGDH